jgi:hypothetical protein
MGMSVSTIHRATYTCDFCGAIERIELNEAKYDMSQYVAGHDEVPKGWVMASSGNPKKSDSIPDRYFDSVEHFEAWREKTLAELRSRMVLL